MSAFKKIKGGICTPLKFKGSTAAGGIKNPEATRLDLALVYSEVPCVTSGTFTTNKVQAAPVKLSRKHIKDGDVRAIFVNSGNANACTGTVGANDALATAAYVATNLKLKASQIAVCSTGVIGIPMPMERLLSPVKAMTKGLKRSSGTDVAKAIMTSDTTHKEIAVSFKIGDQTIKIGACAKGAGMICPSMATMLCFITTDMKLSKELLDQATLEAVKKSFNRITIDGDMSTNDTAIVMANGAAENRSPSAKSKSYALFKKALQFVMLEMAKALVRDGERVTKFVTVEVINAKKESDAQKIAEAVSNSALVKASWNGEDPNWGRIIHAVGYAQAYIREEKINISIDGKLACKGGLQAVTEMQELREIVSKPSFTITIDLNLGDAEYTVYSSDLSPEYIDFNRSEYAYWKQARKDGLI